jgi:predicted dehydrogenase
MSTPPEQPVRRGRVRIAVVGLGGMGALHAETIARALGAAELAAVVDLDGTRSRAEARTLSTSALPTAEAILERPDIDAVVIATPTDGHAPLVERALAAGKHVFCEKPLTLDLASTRELLARASSAGLVLQVGFHRRFDRAWLAVARAIDDGDLGEIRLFRASQRDQFPPNSVDSIAAFGGLFVDALIHELDCARWLVGEVAELHAYGASLTSPEYAAQNDADHALLVLRFASGALGVLDYSRAAVYGYECSAEILGELGTLRLGYNPQPVDLERLAPGARTVTLPVAHQERHHRAYVAELDHFVQAVGGAARTDASPSDLEAALALALAATRSLHEQRPVEIHTRAPAGGER